MANELTTSATLKAQLLAILNEIIHENVTVHHANVRISAKAPHSYVDDHGRITEMKVSPVRDVSITVSYSTNSET